MKLLYIYIFFGLILGTFSKDSSIPVKKKVLDRAVKKSFGVKDYELKLMSDLKQNTGDYYNISHLESAIGTLYIGMTESCRIGGCSAEGYEESEINLDSEYFRYFILLDTYNTVMMVRVYDYNATYGYEICSPLWLNQFKGYNHSEPIVLGEDIDAISGATISSEAMVKDLMRKVDAISLHQIDSIDTIDHIDIMSLEH